MIEKLKKKQHTPKSPLDRGDFKRREKEKKQHTPKSPLSRGDLKNGIWRNIIWRIGVYFVILLVGIKLATLNPKKDFLYEDSLHRNDKKDAQNDKKR